MVLHVYLSVCLLECMVVNTGVSCSSAYKNYHLANRDGALLFCLSKPPPDKKLCPERINYFFAQLY